MNYIKKGKTGNYWGQSGNLDRIVSMLTPQRRRTIVLLLEEGASLDVKITARLSPDRLLAAKDEADKKEALRGRVPRQARSRDRYRFPQERLRSRGGGDPLDDKGVARVKRCAHWPNPCCAGIETYHEKRAILERILHKTVKTA